ncbi:MAG TPA: MBL fold metallo-hydrolase [Geminicoccaceae bacterium]|nr:MBL fold metallo-hydrolase [Geminicoccaceae bacterium]
MPSSAGVAAADALTYERAALSIDGEPCELSPGLFGVRFALPFALDHVNIWLLAGDDWTLVDAGLADQPSYERWRDLARFMAGRPVGRVLATHFHPDHMGLAGWWCQRAGAELWASRTEWLQGRLLALDVSEEFVAAGRLFDQRAGLDREQVDERAARGNLYRLRVTPPPAGHRRLGAGDRPVIGGESWQVIIGRGHAPEMVCLYSPERNLLIAADQVLPRISPIVGVWPGEPEANPLAEFLASLEELRRLPDDCLVLPSHGRPFRGLHVRIDQLVAHHRERLAATMEACRRPATAVEIMPRLFDRELDRHQLGFAIAETVAHLNYLLAEGRIERRLDADGRLRYRQR